MPGPLHPIVIAGAGLAGVSAALSLSATGPVLLADAQTEEAASRAAISGLANPLMSIRGAPVWRVDAALASLDRMSEELGVEPSHRGMVRPANSWKQVEAFRARSEKRPDLSTWVPAGAARERWPWLNAPFGALDILKGGAWNVPSLLEAGLKASAARGVSVQRGWQLESWEEQRGQATARFSSPDGLHAVPCGTLILCVGAGAGRLEGLRELNLHPIKGQLVTVSVASPPPDVRPISGGGYVVPTPEGFVLGSSYEHEFESTSPTRVVSRQLLSRATEDLPWLEGATIEAERAGIRITVPDTRMPMVGPLPGHSSTWVFSGLGSKGLLSAPVIADSLPEWLTHPGLVPREIGIRTLQ